MKPNHLIVGAHTIIYSKKPEADRLFFRDVLGFPHVDVGEGWLIFALPPAELAIHPTSGAGKHELYLMCKDIREFVASMKDKGVACSPIQNLGWGKRTQIKLPGGSKLGVYQALHARPGASKRRK